MSASARVPFVNLGAQYESLREEILEAFDRISRRGAYILSEDVEIFEKAIAAYCESAHAIAVGNGADALYLSMLACGVGPGDEVITAPNSFIASAWTIQALGARPVFVDVTNDYNIDVRKIERAITPKTRALMPVHLTGKLADMNPIMEIADTRRLLVFEDAAQAIGATYRGRKAGSFGKTGCFSLHPLKNLHVHGDGGIIVTQDKDLADKLKRLRNHGLKNRDEADLWGRNSRLDSIQAAIGNIKLKHLDRWTARFRAIAKRYGVELGGCVEVPREAPHEVGVYHRYVIQSDRRDALQAFLGERGVETKVNYPIPLHLQPVGRSLGHKEGDFPVTERLATRILSLPIYPELTDDQVTHVIEQVRAFHAQR